MAFAGETRGGGGEKSIFPCDMPLAVCSVEVLWQPVLQEELGSSLQSQQSYTKEHYNVLPALLKGLHDSMIADFPIAKQSKLPEEKNYDSTIFCLYY